ncbi:MAG: hypothetical protein Q8P67_23145, partial [archaeon]|nr:hypothetical protein [archaeon]
FDRSNSSNHHYSRCFDASPHGVWIISESLLQNYQPLVSVFSDLLQLSSPILSACLHPITKELLLLVDDPSCHSFELLLAMLDGHSVSVETLCSLPYSNFSSSSTTTFSASSISGIFCQDRLLIIFSPSSTWFFDTTTGIPVAPPQRLLDPQPWNTAPVLGAPHGIVSAADNSLWQFLAPPIFHQAAEIIGHQHLSPQQHQPHPQQHQQVLPPLEKARRYAAAVQLCADWGLDGWKAKYLIDFLLVLEEDSIPSSSSPLLSSASLSPSPSSVSDSQAPSFQPQQLRKLVDHSTRQLFADLILDNSQNPGLVLALLAEDRTSRGYLQRRISHFLASQPQPSHDCEATPALDAEAKVLRSRESFEYHTKLNSAIADTLHLYYERTKELDDLEQQLDAGLSTPEVSSEPLPIGVLASSLFSAKFHDGADLLEIPVAGWELFALQLPQQAFAFCRQLLSQPIASTLLYHSEPSSSSLVASSTSSAWALIAPSSPNPSSSSPTPTPSSPSTVAVSNAPTSGPFFFEMLVRLHYRYDLDGLLPFIDSVAAGDPDSTREVSHWYELATAAGLPALTRASMCELPLEELDVRNTMIERAGFPIVALRNFLSTPLRSSSQVQRVLRLLGDHAKHDLTHSVIFNLMFYQFLPMIAGASEQVVPLIDPICSQICDSAPTSLTASQILQLLSESRANWTVSEPLRPITLGSFKKMFLSKLSSSPVGTVQ